MKKDVFKGLQNPQKMFYHKEYPEQLQKAPGLESAMQPVPDCGEDSAIQQNLFDQVDRKKHARIMEVADRLNSGFARNILTLGIQGTDRSWKLRQEKLSPAYTTKLKDIIQVK